MRLTVPGRDPLHPLLAESWRSGQALHVDGITFRSGRVLLLLSRTLQSGARIECVASPLAETTVDSVLRYNPDAWVTLTELAALPWEPGLRISCGEGAMGNEGFVAVCAQDDHGEGFEWLLFSSRSNPFTALSRQGEDILAEAGYGQRWRIPVAAPQDFVIETVE